LSKKSEESGISNNVFFLLVTLKVDVVFFAGSTRQRLWLAPGPVPNISRDLNSCCCPKRRASCSRCWFWSSGFRWNIKFTRLRVIWNTELSFIHTKLLYLIKVIHSLAIRI
jgi:hypothetical protein